MFYQKRDYWIFVLCFYCWCGNFSFFKWGFLQGTKTALMAISGLSFVFSVFLVYIQIKKIKNFCIYCLASALITIFIFVNVLLL
ncbi:hypothetical protein J4422_00770 [Candidatus Pacearchaeota archaeon]|nr:hypothetical protein [Candidatus Pacearchaeota archaeon]